MSSESRSKGTINIDGPRDNATQSITIEQHFASAEAAADGTAETPGSSTDAVHMVAEALVSLFTQDELERLAHKLRLQAHVRWDAPLAHAAFQLADAAARRGVMAEFVAEVVDQRPRRAAELSRRLESEG
ncbi:MAG: hypothetical protein KTR31_33235 [Myxococcales bacterium]|nr:hypothetical protein [Myxococcales bacterium]